MSIPNYQTHTKAKGWSLNHNFTPFKLMIYFFHNFFFSFYFVFLVEAFYHKYKNHTFMHVDSLFLLGFIFPILQVMAFHT